MRDTVSEETCRREAFGIPLVGWLLLVCECEGGRNLESRPTTRRTGILDGIPRTILVLFTQTRPSVWGGKNEGGAYWLSPRALPALRIFCAALKIRAAD